ncbi:MAG: hypothetical protein H0Z32_06645 [Bacillaceae bacterium]|nr:hypothetical protein [Bacillaceae bacterium]
MEQKEIHEFLRNFFELNQCSIVHEKPGKLMVQLTEDMDRLLMNRPFYWEYIKKIGRQGEPAVITLISGPDRKDEEGEWIHFGSPRLHQIFQALQDQNRYSVVYEQAEISGQNQPLIPWLVLNIKISYKGRQKKDEILSLGLHLINGAILHSFMETMKTVQLDTKIGDYCYTISPIIRFRSGYRRIERYLQTYVEEQNKDWAKEAYRSFQEEKELLDHFYHVYLENEEKEEREKKEAQYRAELNQLEKRLLPEIHIQTINGGIFYLTNKTTNRLLTL